MFVVLCICSSMICVFAHCVDVQNDLCFQCMSVSLGLLYVVCVCCVCVCVWSDTCRQAKLLQLNTFYNWTNGNSSLHLDISLNFLALFEIPFGRASMYDVGHRRFMVEYFQNLCTRFMNGIGYDFAALHVALLVGILAKLVSDCHYIDDVSEMEQKLYLYQFIDSINVSILIVGFCGLKHRCQLVIHLILQFSLEFGGINKNIRKCGSNKQICVVGMIDKDDLPNPPSVMSNDRLSSHWPFVILEPDWPNPWRWAVVLRAASHLNIAENGELLISSSFYSPAKIVNQ